LREVEDLLQHSLREVRTVSHLLHPPLLEESGLLSAIRWYAEEFSKRSRIKLTLEYDEMPQRFSPEVETGIFRIVQEALTNVYRHSHAEAVQVRVSCMDGRLTLSIHDDGSGIPPDVLRMAANGRKGVGLASMRERSALLGGTFSAESNGHGTSISVTVPIQTSKGQVHP
jgi:signal transduction histidine kinase